MPPTQTTSTILVPMAQMRVVGAGAGVLETRSIGSCLGIAFFDPQTRAGALLHAMFPIAALNPECAREEPAMFTDTGITAAVKELEALGAQRAQLVIRMAGAGQLLGGGPTFQMGTRNLAVAREMFRRLGLRLDTEDTGGNHARTLRLDLHSGAVDVVCVGVSRRLGEAVPRPPKVDQP